MRTRRLIPCLLLVGCSTTDPEQPGPEWSVVPMGEVRAEVDVAPGAPAEADSPAVLKEVQGIFVTSANPERPRLRYNDGQLSWNNTCFIRIGNKLNDKLPPLYINGAPVGFC